MFEVLAGNEIFGFGGKTRFSFWRENKIFRFLAGKRQFSVLARKHVLTILVGKRVFAFLA